MACTLYKPVNVDYLTATIGGSFFSIQDHCKGKQEKINSRTKTKEQRERKRERGRRKKGSPFNWAGIYSPIGGSIRSTLRDVTLPVAVVRSLLSDCGSPRIPLAALCFDSEWANGIILGMNLLTASY